MRQHTHGFIALLQRLLMGTDVDAIGETTDDEYLRTGLPQFDDKLANQIGAIGGTVAGAYHIDDFSLIERGGSLIIEYQGGIRTIAQTLRVTVVGHAEDGHLVGFSPGIFRFSTAHGVTHITKSLVPSR